jgi:hypothetical protein
MIYRETVRMTSKRAFQPSHLSQVEIKPVPPPSFLQQSSHWLLSQLSQRIQSLMHQVQKTTRLAHRKHSITPQHSNRLACRIEYTYSLDGTTATELLSHSAHFCRDSSETLSHSEHMVDLAVGTRKHFGTPFTIELAANTAGASNLLAFTAIWHRAHAHNVALLCKVRMTSFHIVYSLSCQ